jgi:UDP-N-acetylmuramoyl-tripeptide--D-alanyl-D-alanine ligase
MVTGHLYDLFIKSSGITTDSRNVRKGQIFVALWGNNFNGNNYASEALEKGASWAVIDDPQYENEKTILVDDCLFELQALALHHRKMMNFPVIAITGTNGKTTTKELLASVLARKYKVHFTQGNLNNQIGVPLTILSTPVGTNIMIVEMGANHIGEINALCHIARPDHGILTNIGTAHIEGFGSAEGVVTAKTELYGYLNKVNGIALYNDKNPLLSEKIYKMVKRAVPFSDPTGVDLDVELISSELNLIIRATYQRQVYNITTNLFGSFNLENIKAAIGTGLFFGVEMNDIVNAIESYQPKNNRSQIRYTGRNTLICDSYNANPSSMQMALESFSGIKSEKKILILGDMLELGKKTDEEHLKLVNDLHFLNADQVYLVGPVFKKLIHEPAFMTFSDVNKLTEHLCGKEIKDATILIKGSRGIGLERIYDIL